MLSQRQTNRENIIQLPKGDKTVSMLHKVISTLKRQKSVLEKENQQLQKSNHEEAMKHQMEVDGLKKRIAQLSQENIVCNLLAKETGYSSRKTKQENNKEKQYQIQVQHCKSMLREKEKIIQVLRADFEELNKKVKQAVLQKQKNMELSLMQKINLEQKMDLMEKQISSKKNIIEGMKKQIERVNKLEFTVSQKEKKIVIRGREMEKYEKQIENYYLQNEKRYKRKIQGLDKENEFLKKEFKKIAKKVKNSCSCEGEAEEWKQRLFKMGKQLAKARVQLGKVNFKQQRVKALKNSPLSEESVGSLTLSEESEQEFPQRK